MKPIVKLSGLEINNIKNVGFGSFKMNQKENGGNILGVYGQNGSGKTAIIKSIEIIKLLMTGEELPYEIVDYLKKGSKESVLKAEFELSYSSEKFKIIYEFGFKGQGKNRENFKLDSYIVSFEKISYSRIGENQRTRNNVLFEYNTENGEGLLPKKNYKHLIEGNQVAEDDIRLMIRNQYNHPQSVLFSTRFLEILIQSGIDSYVKEIFNYLKHFAIYYIMVCDNEVNGVVNANILIPFQFLLNYENAEHLVKGGINLMSKSSIPVDIYKMVKTNIDTISNVISELVPNLNIKLHEYGTTFEEGVKVKEVELISIHNKVRIPMRLESDGIKKIVSVLACIISAFNNETVLLAIDEFDSGVFEFLLGEILSVFHKEGKGQIIFTSHNFRALEVLGKNCIIVTTTNENNRFIRFKNIRPNNNLRDTFYRDLILGGQDECLYEPTNSYRISSSLRKAGDFIG